MRRAFLNSAAMVAAVLSLTASAAMADNLYTPGSWSAMASDRLAEKVGDSLTVVIQEASQASDSTQIAHDGKGGLFGRYLSGSNKNNGQAGLSGDYNVETSGQHGRSGHMAAQISVVVDEVLPNGDLHVSGDQMININGEKTQIHLKGRVRRADISSSNTVFSTSLADATIVYGGPGLTGNKDKPGVFHRMFSWMKP